MYLVPFFGLPFGLRVDCRPNWDAVAVVHGLLP